MVFSSPKELISWMELSRPTVRGRTACGKSTVSRTGKTGKPLWLVSITEPPSTMISGESLVLFRVSDAIILFLDMTTLNDIDDSTIKNDAAILTAAIFFNSKPQDFR